MSRLYSGLRILLIAATVWYTFTACSLQPGKDSLVIQKVPSGTSRNIMSDCLKCHSDKTPSIDPLLIGGEGTAGKHTVHVSDRNIACIKCHSGYAEKDTHMDGILETGNSLIHFDPVNPDGKWISDTGPGTGSCSSLNCHGGETLDWFTTQKTWTLPACSVCHASSEGTRRQVLGAGGDFDRKSHHVIDYSNRTNEIVTSSDCTVCHNMDNHMSGTIRLNNEDDSSKVILYDPSDPSSLEPFCLSCHDSDGATVEGADALSPFSDTNTLGVIPNEAGNKIAGYWKSSSNIHKDTGGLTCAGTGEPGTGCHGNNGTINMHGSVSKGLLTKNLTLPVSSSSTYNSNYSRSDFEYDFELCLSCHNNYPSVSKEVVLGYKEGGNFDVSWAPTPYYTAEINSLFRDRYIASSTNYPAYWFNVNQPYNDTIWGDSFTPLHNYHLLGDGFMPNVWNYRGSGETGRASCITCHNVHGTSGTVRSTYSVFGLTVFSGAGSDKFRKLVPDSNYQDSVLKAYPVNCNISCHSMGGSTSYWDIPSGE